MIKMLRLMVHLVFSFVLVESLGGHSTVTADTTFDDEASSLGLYCKV